MQLFFDVLLCLLSAYGLTSLVIAALQRFGTKTPKKHTGIRLVLLVKDVEEQIEYIIRNAVKNDLPAGVLSENKLVVVDMGSTDKTCNLLEKLQKDFPCLEVLEYEERTQIFDISGSMETPPSFNSHTS